MFFFKKKTKKKSLDKSGVIMVGGIYGVGKTYLIKKTLKEHDIDIPILKGSLLMTEYLGLSSPKELSSQTLERRQKARTHMFKILRDSQTGVRDAHFSVLGDDGKYEFPFDPNDNAVAAVLLWAEPEDILRHRKRRKDRKKLDLIEIENHQKIERQGALDYSKKLGIPLYVIKNNYNIDTISTKLANILKKHNN